MKSKFRNPKKNSKRKLKKSKEILNDARRWDSTSDIDVDDLVNAIAKRGKEMQEENLKEKSLSIYNLYVQHLILMKMI